MGDAQSSRFDFRRSLPYVVFFVLVLVLFLSSTLSQRPPEVQSVSPRIVRPGEELVIRGRFFGAERDGGRVVLGGYSPPTSSYLSWEERRISVIVPEEMASGLLQVVTRHGDSRQVIVFTNEADLPRVVSGPQRPGQAYIDDFEPTNGPPGTVITITGVNFGLARGNSQVHFAWVSGDRSTLPADGANLLAAAAYDHDYVSWHDREIAVRVPDGASSGNLTVVTDKGESNSVYFEVKDAVGSKLFGGKRIYHIQYGVQLGDFSVKGEPGKMHIWVPRPVEGAEQREVKLIQQQPVPLFQDFEGFSLFVFEDITPARRRSIEQSFMLTVYEVETKINRSRIDGRYDTSSKLYQVFTSADALVPADDATVIKTARSVVGSDRNPFSVAWRVFQYVLQRLSPETPSEPGVVAALTARKGDSRIYALLFTAMARASGVPARPVSGYLITGENKAVRHMWAEFYLQGFGWVPVDPYLADGARFGDFPSQVNPGAYYFGNLDNRRIAFSHGLSQLAPMDPRGKSVTRGDTVGLQTIHEEYSGGLAGYTAAWSEVDVLGVY